MSDADWLAYESEMTTPEVTALVHLMEDRAEWESSGWPIDPS